MPDTILIVEDEPRMGAILQDYFSAHGVDSDLAPDGDAALERFAQRDYDAVLLDVMMPGLDGYGVCRAIRRESGLPILFLTALGGEAQALHGYALGADDYITKPFSLALLYAKTTALIRRSRGTEDGALVCGAIRLQPGPMLCTVGNTAVKLSPREYDLLLCLLRNRGKVLSREQLLARVWGWDFEGEDRAVDVQVKNLRAALGSAGKQIKTVFKAGYKLESE
ncbi:response regulator transcription factor [Intestinimonas timonensis]|uniref:response regulator transcription factor n=1 Tax=Intestinimonas timonensis TaxID=1689270 RepID=UPI0023F2F236|nr:response regulator transcription factor [Intestinimonas timonensis]